MKYHLPEIELAPIAHGEHIAFEQMFKKVYNPLVACANKLVKDNTVAEEIVDDVLLNIWNNRAGLTSINNFSSYLLLSIRNRATNFLQRNKRKYFSSITHDAYNSYVDVFDPERELLNRELTVRINTAIESLSYRKKTCFKLIKIYGFGYRETADMMGISVNTVDAHLVSATKKVILILRHVK